MSTTVKRFGAALSAVVLAGGATALVPAVANGQAPDDSASVLASDEESTARASVETGLVTESVVEGVFTFDQETVTGNETIASMFKKAASTLCGAAADGSTESGAWAITVSGDVDHGFTASVEELDEESEGTDTRLMTCTCSNNLPGGGAIATAEVDGVSVEDLLVRSGAHSDVNTVTFRASDGTERSFSLDYVLGHEGVIATQINGEPVAESVGGTNQLWLSGSAGKYFVRDVVDVEFSAQETPPADPGFEATGGEYMNRPNVSAKASAA